MPAALCAGRLSIMTISLRLRVGARNLAPFIEPSTVHGARMPLRRSAATKVMVFQWPCGTRPISLSPRGQRPLSRTILVLAAVSSTKTRWAGSNMPCSRIQRWRARATSARSCSAACRLFFESDVVMLEEAPHRAAAARNLVPVHRQNRLVQGQVWPSRNQTQQKICMLLQRRDAPAPRLSRTAARLPKALDPDNRRAGTDIKLLGRRAPRRPAFNFRNHSRPHVFRIGLRHRPASQNRINADRLSHPSPSENLLDSIGTEHALDVELVPFEAGSPDELGRALDGIAVVKIEAVNVLASPFLQVSRPQIIGRMRDHRLPAIYQWPESAEDGGLLAYGPRQLLCDRH